MPRRLLAILWTFHDDLRCELTRLSDARWELAVWRGADQLRAIVVATLEAVHTTAHTWREEYSVPLRPGTAPATATAVVVPGESLNQPDRSVRERSAPASILLVDAAHPDRDMYSELLQTCGFRVHATSDLGEALNFVNDADAIVTETRLPGDVDGLELVRHVGRRDGRKVPIVVLTSWAWSAERERAARAGCDVFLPKPCLPDRLVAELRRVLRSTRVRRVTPLVAQAAERRRPERPHHGERTTCCRCGGYMIFCDRLALLLDDGMRQPGWICETASCGYRAGVRRTLSEAQRQPAGSPRRFALIADDDEGTRRVYCEQLRALGYETQETGNGLAALAKALAETPSLIVTDTNLPGLNGLSLCELLRREKQTEAVGILVITADHSRDIRARARAAGANVVLRKPCSPKLLLGTITKLLKVGAMKSTRRTTAPNPRVPGGLSRRQTGAR